MRTRRVATGLTTVVACVALALTSPGAAFAHSPKGHDDEHHHHHHAPHVRTLNTDVVAPFQLAVSKDRLYVADGGTSQVSWLGRHGLVPVAHGPQPGEVAGVAFDASGKTLAFTASGPAGTTLTIQRKGRHTIVADLSGFEVRHDPDHKVTYGVDHPSQCVQDAFAPLGGATSKGIVDSHPYSVASLGHGSWVVADAAGNDLLKVDSRGHVSLLALLPRQPTVITSDIAAGLGLPSCVVGVRYNFEPVPTDVEVGPHGKLYVSLLPGGPEDPSLGARGSVYTLNHGSRHSKRLATGFVGATNVAVDSHGKVYVAELFAGQISTIEHGRPHRYVALPGALSVEWGDGHLYASTLAPMDESGNPTGTGSLVRIDR